MINLYLVKLGVNLVIAADTRDDAVMISEKYGEAELRQCGADSISVDDGAPIPFRLYETIPWGLGELDEPEQTIGSILAAQDACDEKSHG